MKTVLCGDLPHTSREKAHQLVSTDGEASLQAHSILLLYQVLRNNPMICILAEALTAAANLEAENPAASDKIPSLWRGDTPQEMVRESL